MKVAKAELRAFCGLVASDGLGATAVLRTQLRHASNVALALAQSPLARTLGVLDANARHIEHALHEARSVAEEWSDDPVEAFSRFIDARARAAALEEDVLGSTRRVVRSLRQAAYVRGGDYPYPGLFFGLEQARILDRVSAIARSYHADLRAPAPLDRPPVVNIAYDYVPLGSHRFLLEPIGGSAPVDHTQVSVPIWLLYYPRYLPTICHELAHPAALAMSKHQDLAGARLALNHAVTAIVDERLGTGVADRHPNFASTLGRELVTDLLSLRVAGPAYAYAWYASALGRGPIGDRVRVSLPTWVRLQLLSERVRERATDTVRTAMEQDCELYSELLVRRGYREKLAYQESLLDPCRSWMEEVSNLLGLHQGNTAPEDWSAMVREVFEAVAKLDQYSASDLLRGVDPAQTWHRDAARSTPALLFEVHLREALDPSCDQGVTRPEGRVFHALHDRWRGWREGQYFEWLWIKRIDRSAAGPFLRRWRAAVPDRATVHLGAVIGKYDFVALRERFQARTYDDYPPLGHEGAYHARRQIAVQMVRSPREGDEFADAFAGSAPLLVAELRLHAETDASGVLDTFFDAPPTGVRPISAFRSLGSDDLLLVGALTDLVAVRTFVRWSASQRCKSNTCIVLPEARAPEARRRSTSAPIAEVISFLRFAATPDREVWARVRKAAAKAGSEPVLRVLGDDDVEIRVPIRDVGDLARIVRMADVLLRIDSVTSFDARIGYQDDDNG